MSKEKDEILKKQAEIKTEKQAETCQVKIGMNGNLPTFIKPNVVTSMQRMFKIF